MGQGLLRNKNRHGRALAALTKHPACQRIGHHLHPPAVARHYAPMSDLIRKLIAVLLALRALTNLGKPFGSGSGLVIVGKLFHGAAITIIAPLLGLAMLVYAYGLWTTRPWARPLGIAYAIFATLNVLLFPFVEGVPERYAPWMYAFYAAPGIGIPWLAVWLLGKAPRLTTPAR